MVIENYISKLLYRHDCVTLPGLGGFVTNYAPAKIHSVNHTFYPPSKTILFNSKLANDDGLLIHEISISEKISYEQAKNDVLEFVDNCKMQIEDNGFVKLLKIGSITKNREGGLLFEPDTTVNYLEEAYGLATFVSPPIARKPLHRRLEQKFTDRKPVPYEERKKRKAAYAYLAIVPVIIIIGWLIFNTNFRNDDIQQSGIVNVPEQFSSENENPNETLAKNSELNTSDSDIISGSDITNTEPSAESVFEPPKPVYYIIGGAFQYEDNAKRFVATLRSKGYNAKQAGLSRRGLHIVSYFDSSDKSEALMNLALIRKNDNPSAWLLKK
jgi:hypothetical protein